MFALADVTLLHLPLFKKDSVVNFMLLNLMCQINKKFLQMHPHFFRHGALRIIIVKIVYTLKSLLHNDLSFYVRFSRDTETTFIMGEAANSLLGPLDILVLTGLASFVAYYFLFRKKKESFAEEKTEFKKPTVRYYCVISYF